MSEAFELAKGQEHMSLDEAIAHTEETAMCGGDCGKEHRQLFKWLIELRSLRSNQEDYAAELAEAKKHMANRLIGLCKCGLEREELTAKLQASQAHVKMLREALKYAEPWIPHLEEEYRTCQQALAATPEQSLEDIKAAARAEERAGCIRECLGQCSPQMVAEGDWTAEGISMAHECVKAIRARGTV